MKILVTGATGLVGAEVLRQAISDNAIEQVTALTRRPPIVQHPKIKTVIHQNFLDYSGSEKLFREHDVCIWCLGISQSQVNKDKYHEITYGYTVAAAVQMLRANPDIGFVFLSGEGADQDGKARTLFGKVKGKVEKDLSILPFKVFYIARPGGIRPINKNPDAPKLYKMLYPLFPVMEFLFPSKMINSVQVAKALLHIAKNGATTQIIENVALKKLSSI